VLERCGACEGYRLRVKTAGARLYRVPVAAQRGKLMLESHDEFRLRLRNWARS
jgi:hypothetical protein